MNSEQEDQDVFIENFLNKINEDEVPGSEVFQDIEVSSADQTKRGHDDEETVPDKKEASRKSHPVRRYFKYKA